MEFEHSEVLQSLPKQFFATLVKKVNQKVASGADVINLGQGNPDQPTPDNIVKAMQAAVAKPENHKYSPFTGLFSLKQAIANYYKREYQVDLDPKTEVAILGGSKTGLVELPLALLNPGDTLLLPNPGYPDYLSGVSLAKVKLGLVSLKEENNFLPDYKTIDTETKQKAKLLYLNYPNNPTGAIATPKFFEDTVKFAQDNQVGIVHDFAYGALGYQQKPVSFLQTPGAKDVGIEVYTLSKTYNMAGWRIVFALGNHDIIKAIELIQNHLFVSVFPAIQEAAITALNGSQESVAKLNDLYNNRRKAFEKAASQIGWKAYPAKGSFYSWMPVPKGYNSESFADLLLDKASVAVAPGAGFGKAGDRFVRIGLLTSSERLQEACQRIGKLHLFD
ncbi:aspartate aminotransferase [Fructilactobacillus lindneri]|uniref:Aminotransferase n=2 Tax=Fructilactobacillus lindneri TaxID=53444 RepID=A0A0R2JTT3_9LACO|nr:pyridoxal phosphate-dependent aminotransferase [Fructilactobacillus lindneri]ANZ57523.1 aspartate aminotransferase [Fructilactobacillus lindneri]ANZ58791.1 aspartate aminotransferase [Fructilactobacillus lindneri]KRN80512.1 aminotransferase [Fructilactobacillus lindneri DSM 20690 = JCM 11027]POG97781.1 aspartate aminotransferase [Fructilactobacillus lindneri]POG99113.1 aspartate aminotransferase [Fructilactobacillus lindneri]